MKIIAIIALLALIVPCIAEPNSVTTGPYKITFDLRIPNNAYKVEIAEPETTESLSGDISTRYTVNLINKTGVLRRASIILTSHETEQVTPSQDELVQVQKYSLLQIDNLYNIDAAKRKIDGKNGAVGSATLRIPETGLNIDTYTAIYCPSSTTVVNLYSSYPWDEGTLSLLKTIHVEENNSTS